MIVEGKPELIRTVVPTELLERLDFYEKPEVKPEGRILDTSSYMVNCNEAPNSRLPTPVVLVKSEVYTCVFSFVTSLI